jgi:hypothetical protein
MTTPTTASNSMMDKEVDEEAEGEHKHAAAGTTTCIDVEEERLKQRAVNTRVGCRPSSPISIFLIESLIGT